MQYTFEAAEKSTVKIKITLNADEWKDAINGAYFKIKGKFTIPGFRKGHAPKHVIEQQYGKGVFFEEAINYAFPKYYYDILDKEPSIEAIDRPELDVENIDDNGITLIAVVPVKPEVKLGAYKGIKFDKIEYNVTDKEIDDELDRLVKRNVREVEVTDRAAKKGDVTTIDYSGSVNGVKFAGGTAENQTLELGSGQFIPGFEEQVEGMKIGEEKDITVKFPEDYHAEDLKGKEAVFTVKLKAVKEKQYPEANDEFIKEAAGEDSIESFRAATRAKLEANNAQKAKAELEDKIIKTIADSSEVEIPDALVERQEDAFVQDMEYRMMYQGLKLQDYLKYTKQTVEEYKKGFEKQAKEQVKAQLVIEKIMATENIKATEEEVDAKIADQAVALGKDAGEYKKTLNDRQISYFENNASVDKLFAFLLENNQID